MRCARRLRLLRLRAPRLRSLRPGRPPAMRFEANATRPRNSEAPLRILMALDYYRPYVSGLSMYVERLGHALTGRGHDITVLTHRHAPGLAAEEEVEGVRIVRAGVLARIGKALLSPALLAKAHRELAHADIFHLH